MTTLIIIGKSVKYDFKLKYKKNLLAISLYEGILNEYSEETGKKIGSYPIREFEGVLQVWDNEEEAWSSVTDEILRGYSDYLAEKVLLKE